MPGLHPDIDPNGLLEYSVVFTDRSLNHMSASFRGVVKYLSATLKRTYSAQAVAIIPGGGTYAMEAVARQFATDRRCLIIRNGWFSYRWSQILETGKIAPDPTVVKARPANSGFQAPFTPPPVDEVIAAIDSTEPQVVFAPHVETSSGIILPDDYLTAVANATHRAGGIFVLDAIASGAIWVDMATSGVDVLISAPQKGWSGSPCAGLVLLGPDALARLPSTRSTTFSADLRMWLKVMDAYENDGHTYHCTMPTDALKMLAQTMAETEAMGLEVARERQQEMGRKVRTLLVKSGFPSVAARGFEAPGVVVSYTDDPAIRNGKKFATAGLQIAAGVPLRCDERDDFCTFRLGLFGIDKLNNVDTTVSTLADALRQVTVAAPAG